MFVMGKFIDEYIILVKELSNEFSKRELDVLMFIGEMILVFLLLIVLNVFGCKVISYNVY